MTTSTQETDERERSVKSSPSQSLAVRKRESLHFFAYFPIVYPKTVLMLCFALALLASLYAAQHLQLVAGRSDSISSQKRYVQLYKEYSDEFMGLDKVLVVVEPADEQQGKDFVAQLGGLLERDVTHVENVFYRLDLTALEGKQLLYLSPEELRTLRQHLETYKDVIRELASTPGLNTLLHTINQQVSTGMTSHLVAGFLGLDSPAEPTGQQKPMQILVLQSLLQELERALSTTDYSYRSPW